MPEDQPTIQTSIALMCKDIKNLNKNVDKLVLIMEGNGKDGLITMVALLKASVSRIWLTIGSMTTLFGIVVGVIKFL